MGSVYAIRFRLLVYAKVLNVPSEPVQKDHAKIRRVVSHGLTTLSAVPKGSHTTL